MKNFPQPQEESVIAIPPHNIDAEEAVLGAMMIDTSTISEIIDYLQPDDFYLESHRWLYFCLTLADSLYHLDFRGQAFLYRKNYQLKGLIRGVKWHKVLSCLV